MRGAGALALGAGVLLAAVAVSHAAPTWEKTFTIGTSPASILARGIRWVKKPNDSDIFARFPEAAFRERLSGVTLLECTATATGKLADCAIVEEVPEGKGFAAASIAVMDLYEFGPRDRITPEIVGRKVRVPIIWTTKRNSTREVRP
jgi:hypothetical protein